MAIFVGSQLVKRFDFPAGECHVVVDKIFVNDEVKVTAHLTCANDIMDLMLVIDAIRKVNSKAKITLDIPYFPYARQNRIAQEGEALSSKVMVGLISSLNCDEVVIYDPHFAELPGMIKNCQSYSLADLFMETKLPKFLLEKSLTLLAPDEGAKKKLDELAVKLQQQQIQVEVIYAKKERDPVTREVQNFNLEGSLDGKNVMVIDDICDEGQTFVSLAKLLKAKGAKDLYVYATHGIFSNGLAALNKNFKHIFCYFSIFNKVQNSEFLTVLTNDKN